MQHMAARDWEYRQSVGGQLPGPLLFLPCRLSILRKPKRATETTTAIGTSTKTILLWILAIASMLTLTNINSGLLLNPNHEISLQQFVSNDEDKHHHGSNGQQDKTRKEKPPPQDDKSDNLNSGGRNGHSCLFVVSTSQRNTDFVQQQFESYQNDDKNSHVGILINIYDSPEPSNATTLSSNDDGGGGGDSRNASTTKNTMFYRFPGLKPSLWTKIDPDLVRNYEHIWFLDDDLIFDKNYFAFDQFMTQVKLNDAVISTPKIIRYARTAKPHKGTRSGEEFGLEAGEIVDFIEIDSFVFKSKAWIWFQENILIDTPNSAWGPDCFWCDLFKYERQNRGNQFGKVDCFRSLLYGVVHMDTKSLTSTFKGEKTQLPALSAYQTMLSEKYNGDIKFYCRGQRKAETVPMKRVEKGLEKVAFVGKP